MTIADMCFCARKSLKMSQKDFAKLLRTNQTEVSFIERGFVPNDTQKVSAIERIYNDTLKGTDNNVF